jgi:hypothetical protein
MTSEEEAHTKSLAELACLNDQDKWWLERRIGKISDWQDPRRKLSKKRIRNYLMALSKIYDNAWWRSIC